MSRSATDYDYGPEDTPPRKPRGCACFGPGEAGGTCPGQENCPMACDEPEEPQDDKD
jgi:hypothetical protein